VPSILVTQEQTKAKKFFLRKLTQPKSKENNHGHSYLPPFGIIEKRMITGNRLKQGVCNHQL